MANEPLTGAPIPSGQGDAFLGGQQINQAVSAIAPFTIPLFANASARDAAYAAWVAAGNTMRDNLQCRQTDTGWTYVRRGGKWVPQDASIFAQVRQDTPQTISNNAWTPMVMNAEDADAYAMHSNTTLASRIYAPIDGWYQASGIVWFGTGAGAGRRIVRYNYQQTAAGTPVVPGNGVRGSVPAVTGESYGVVADPMMFLINAGGWIEIQGYQSSGANLDTAVTTDARSGLLLQLSTPV